MIVKNVPELLYSPKDCAEYVFDKNGRIVYVKRNVEKSAPILMVYDLVFNEYVQINPGPSILSFKNENFTFIEIEGYLIFEPIDQNRMLFMQTKDRYPGGDILISLIYFDYKQKIYELLDSCILNDCANPKIIFDDENREKFGLFCRTVCRDGRWEDEEDQIPLLVYTLQMFHINESNKITKNKLTEFDHNYYEVTSPDNLHLYHQNLWNIRLKKENQWIVQYEYRHLHPPPSPNSDYQYISYFDMRKEEKPKENIVDVIKEKDKNKCSWWIKDTLILHVEDTKFRMFNLDTFEWKTIECSFNFFDPKDMPKDEEEDKWTMFNTCNENNVWFTIDQEFNFLGVKRDEKAIYKVPLKSPQKLLDLTWNEALNCEFVGKIISSNVELPYKRLF